MTIKARFDKMVEIYRDMEMLKKASFSSGDGCHMDGTTSVYPNGDISKKLDGVQIFANYIDMAQAAKELGVKLELVGDGREVYFVYKGVAFMSVSL
jgi:hypothetical protein